MFSPISSISLAAVSLASSARGSHHLAFSEALDNWVLESPNDEKDARQRFAQELQTAFHQRNISLSFHGEVSSLPSCIGDLHSLQDLNLNRCRSLTSLPPEIGSLHNLRLLNLRGCSGLTFLPPEIGNLCGLEVLDLSECLGLSSLPSEIGRLHALQELHLMHCSGLTSLPPEIGNLQKLQRLEIPFCRSLTSLPSAIGKLHELRVLRMMFCTSLTALPPEIGNLYNLEDFDLGFCLQLTSLPPEIGLLQKLECLNIDCCTALVLLPINTTDLRELYPKEYKEFVETFNKFLLLMRRFNGSCYVKNEKLLTEEGASLATQAAGRFVTDFKGRLLEKRLIWINEERRKVQDAIHSLWEEWEYFLHEEDHGQPLPVMVLESFIAEDARIHCQRLETEHSARSSQYN